MAAISYEFKIDDTGRKRREPNAPDRGTAKSLTKNAPGRASGRASMRSSFGENSQFSVVRTAALKCSLMESGQRMFVKARTDGLSKLGLGLQRIQSRGVAHFEFGETLVFLTGDKPDVIPSFQEFEDRRFGWRLHLHHAVYHDGLWDYVLVGGAGEMWWMTKSIRLCSVLVVPILLCEPAQSRLAWSLDNSSNRVRGWQATARRRR